MNFKAETTHKQHYRGGTKDVFNIRLPITQRGLFFHDQFFQQARSHFEAAVKDVLSKWDDLNNLDVPFPTRTTSPFGNPDSSVFGRQDPMNCGSTVQEPPAFGTLQRYRQLRSQNLKKESQAVTAFEDQHSYKVILDVRDFLHGDMKVTVKGQRELVVEGAPSGGKQGFSHKFLMPQGVIIDQTTSVLSSDGVLTINTPKMMKPVKENVSVPIEIKANVTKLQGQDRKKALAASFLKKNIQSKINKQIVEDFKTKVREEETKCSDINKNITENGVPNKPMSVVETDLQKGYKPIIRRGNFFKDSIFQDNHTQFNNSVKKAVEKSEEKNTNPMELYRNMRNDNNQNSNRAISVTDGPQIYKITIDVREFTKDGELTVKVVQEKQEKELLVEGHLGYQEQQKSFSETFPLPQHVEISSISSILSTDGVLVITGSHKNVSKSQPTNNQPNSQTSTSTINCDLQSPDSAIGSSRPPSSFSPRPQSSSSSIATPDSLPPLSSLQTGACTPTPFSFPNTAAQMASPSSAVPPYCFTPTPVPASPLSSPVSPPLTPEPKYTSYTELKIRPCSSNSSSEPNTPSSISCSTPSTVILYKLDDTPNSLDDEEEEDMDYGESEDGLMSPGPDPSTLEETCTCGLVH